MGELAWIVSQSEQELLPPGISRSKTIEPNRYALRALVASLFGVIKGVIVFFFLPKHIIIGNT